MGVEPVYMEETGHYVPDMFDFPASNQLFTFI